MKHALSLQQEEEGRRDGDLGRSLDQAWAQDRPVLQQELRLLRHSTVVFYVKLRSLLAHWRSGRRADAGLEGALSEVSPARCSTAAALRGR